MTIQVNTLKINASVSDSAPIKKTAEIRTAPAAAAAGGGDKNEELVSQCVERVLDIIRRELKP